MRIWLLGLVLVGALWAGVEGPWLAELDERGGPLIEEVGEGRSKVTFVYRGNGTEDHVVLVSGVCPRDPEECLMERLGGTDLWMRTELVENDVRTTYRFSPNGSLMPYSAVSLEEFLTEIQEEAGRWRPDPFNGQGGASYSVLEMPEAPKQKWTRKHEGVARGAIAAHKFESELLGNKRELLVYVPPHYSEEKRPYPLVILFDGREYDGIIPAQMILDNLIAAGEIRPCVALLVCNVTAVSRNEELPCNPLFGRFMVEEVMPWMDDHYNVSRHASDVVIGGASFGGLAAAYLALEYPEHFGNVLSQSGAFWWKPMGDEEPGWIGRQYEAREVMPLRFYLDVGRLETLRLFGGPSMLESNARLREMLEKKGYEVVYSEFNGGHDYICWRGTLADGLIATVGKD
jgi:enterochelin esterase-like enzyme